jgi:hypothetical protein
VAVGLGGVSVSVSGTTGNGEHAESRKQKSKKQSKQPYCYWLLVIDYKQHAAHGRLIEVQLFY